MEKKGTLTEEDEALLAALEADAGRRFAAQDRKLDETRDGLFGTTSAGEGGRITSDDLADKMAALDAKWAEKDAETNRIAAEREKAMEAKTKAFKDRVGAAITDYRETGVVPPRSEWPR